MIRRSDSPDRPEPTMHLARPLATMFPLALLVLALAGCAVPQLIAAVGHNIEREKKIEVLAKYTGLENRSVAVLVHADHSLLYEYPMVKPNISANIAARIQQNVSGVRVLSPVQVMGWEYQNPTWSSMPMGQVCDMLDVDRIVYVDVYEFRLNPPGNRFLWEAVGVANVSIYERGSLDPDFAVEEFSVTARFPDDRTVTREQRRQEEIEAGIVGRFCQKIAWLFYDHIEDKYPDRNVRG